MYDDIVNKINKGNYVEAEIICKDLIKKNKKNSDYFYLLGLIYLKTKKFDQSSIFFSKAIKINKKIDYFFAYAEALVKNNHLDEAIKAYESIISIDKNNEPTLVNLSHTYFLIENYYLAEKFILKAIQINNKNANYYKNLGNIYKRQNKLTDALDNYRTAINLDPHNHEIKKGIGLILLTQKKYDVGWNYYDSRIFARQNSGDLFDKIKHNLFNEKIIQSKHKLAIISEQGMGEQILFSSMYKDLINSTKNLKFFIDLRFFDIFKRSFGDQEFIDKNNFKKIDDAIKNGFKFLYAGNLGKFYRKKISNFDGKPFYKVNEGKVKKYKSILSTYPFDKFIGISWKSKRSKFVGKKSLELNNLKELINEPNIGFINLQYGEISDLIKYNSLNKKKVIQINNLDLFNEIDDVLSLIYNLDLVVTTPNLNTHLAGSVGKKCVSLFDIGYEDIMNSNVNDGRNEWYQNLEILQVHDNLEDKIKEIKKNLINFF